MRFGREGGLFSAPLQTSPRGVAHDLRQPLAAIGALVATADRQPDVPEPVQRCLSKIRDQVEELNRLCRRIVDPQGHPWARVAVHDLVASVAESAELAAGRPVTAAAVKAFVDGDAVDLRRAVLNLLDNACRATGPNGQVCLRVTTAEDHVRLEVHDDGPGFGYGSPGSASLGLDIADGVAAEHGGHLEIGESDLGGAAVTLVLPTAPGRDGAEPAVRGRLMAQTTWSDKRDVKDDKCAS